MMTISEVIEEIKKLYKGYDTLSLEQKETRDKILYGDSQQKCRGIVTCLWASMDIIEQTHRIGANFIICHESLFWNHGDHQDWLNETGNNTYRDKRKLLEEYGITVWRCHDLIHSGLRLSDGTFSDGIFYGLAYYLDWIDYVQGNRESMQQFNIPPISVRELCTFIIKKLNLNGLKIIGEREGKVSKVRIPFHIFGDDRSEITYIDHNNIDAILPLEIVDFTVAQYLYDSGKVALCMGHFNLEEPGMRYMAEYISEYLPISTSITFLPMRNFYKYLT